MIQAREKFQVRFADVGMAEWAEETESAAYSISRDGVDWKAPGVGEGTVEVEKAVGEFMVEEVEGWKRDVGGLRRRRRRRGGIGRWSGGWKGCGRAVSEGRFGG